jgi:uncharacterized membrane protein YfcA
LATILLLIGLAIGGVSGIMGIGGGIVIIPILMFFFGFSQQKANGTSLAMLLPPIGIFAVLSYARQGNVNWAFAGVLAAGFAVGAYFGAWFVNRGFIHPGVLRVTFALFLIYVAANLLFRPGGHARVSLEVTLMVAGFGLAYAAMRMLGRKYVRMPSWGNIYRDRLKHPAPYDYEI